MLKGLWVAAARLVRLVAREMPLRILRLMALAELKDNCRLAEEHHGQVVLRGTSPFVSSCSLALTLMRDRDPTNYRRMCQVVREIVEHRFLGATHAFPPGTTGCILLDPRGAAGDPRFLASLLAHEAAHGILSRRYLGLCLQPSAETEERLCLRVQLRCLGRLGWHADEVRDYGETMLGSRWWTWGSKLRRSRNRAVPLQRG